MNNEVNHEYEYKGICVNGFIMLLVIFVILPAVAALWTLWLADFRAVQIIGLEIGRAHV